MRSLAGVVVSVLVLSSGVAAYDAERYAAGEELFKQCLPCHGQYGTKQSMGTNRDITKLDEQQIAKILNDYSLGRSEGAMTAKASLLDNKKIAALSTYIANMNTKYGQELFGLRCSGCHGRDGAKSAFGKSGVVARLSEQELVTVLHNYQSGTYAHGSTANAMKGRAITLNDHDVNALARYIDTIK
ncbi:hypothetical protein AGMMS50229_14020 [Campylobacterota bacterium]|nr:hypothetical protein AGMMS50229_14020 [Campylobacterota bacterium]